MSEIVHAKRRGVAGAMRDWPKGRELSAFIADHLLSGLDLDEMRSRPRE
jgi:hypothetical protein